MKTDALFQDLESKENISVLKETDEMIKTAFESQYPQFQGKMFFEQFMNSGGVVIDGWVRIFGCGQLNVVDKNARYHKNSVVDILIGEDVLGGLFGLKNDVALYFAPDTNEWESLEAYYTQFVFWLTNHSAAVDKFYETFRWKSWKTDCAKLELDKGFSFYPLLQSACEIEKRSRKVVPIDELIRLNLGI